MDYGIYLSAAGAEVQSRRLEVLSHNLANVDTPGFKPQHVVFQERLSEAESSGEDHPGSRTLNPIGGGVLLEETVTGFAQGAIRRTGIPTDLALHKPEHFFHIRKEGNDLLTRAGNFQFDQAGQLRTQQGDEVMGQDGSAVTIDPAFPYVINANGDISQSGVQVASLGLMQPRSMGDLARVGENLFRPMQEADPVTGDDRIGSVGSGELEQSAVKPTRALMEMIETSRAYEANMRMIQHHDHLLGELVGRVLRQ